ncbi:AraC family transcriptional regulator [Aurantimonas sp. 22II-16-19i]|uniref:helix-turn-helix domain-containing protein n=1 Tax=Aurantimonas sp. 22II-16-19i TaxID=1317114 RepID=UPI0009F7A341|nr:AraC family transcriptional regulator [Aurantimonas sp. 22II-16-19i]ORE98470.1 AraC family transcriptional regulator [Aurantimonas sp. 22II-16-19i]
MLALPISIVVSLALAYVLARLLHGRRVAMPLAALLVACILQGVVNALAQYYGVAGFRPLQPVTAVTIPPLAFLALGAAQGRSRAGAALHLLAPAFVAFCVLTAPQAIDVAVVAIFAGYGAAMLVALRSGADALPEARLDAGEWPPLVWRALAASLIASALSDVAIALAVFLGEGWMKGWIVSFGTSLTLLLIGGLAASRSIGPPVAETTAGPVRPAGLDQGEAAAERQRDAAIMADLEQLLATQKLYRDGDLTLARLARRLGLPAKRVSEAINRRTGENVSRYVNGYRIADACAAIEAGQSVTDAMLGSGFATKSNFNREFRRVTGRAPTEWAARGPLVIGRSPGDAAARPPAHPARLTAVPDGN